MDKILHVQARTAHEMFVWGIKGIKDLLRIQDTSVEFMANKCGMVLLLKESIGRKSDAFLLGSLLNFLPQMTVEGADRSFVLLSFPCSARGQTVAFPPGQLSCCFPTPAFPQQ